MEYREIVSVTGLGGLFQLLATKNDGAIVRNLADKSTKFISARLHNVTPLESIEVYTTGDNVRLHEVFQKMKDQAGTALPDARTDNNAVKAYFKSVFPELDDERVYTSDMKKMVKWFEVLKANDLLNFEKLETAGDTEEDQAEEATGKTTDAPAEEARIEEAPKKARAKKSADTESAEEAAEKPKKVAKKKTAEDKAPADGEAAPKKIARKKKED
jgi:hypothetical protein